MKMKRIAFLAAAVGSPILIEQWSRQVEPNWFKLTRTRVPIPAIRPTRLLHIADLHTSD